MRFQAIVLCGILCSAMTALAQAAPFTLTSPGTPDGGKFTSDPAAVRCGGKDISPPFAWTGAPAATASFAMTAWDQDGQKGQGVAHMVVYGIAPTTTSLPAGALSGPAAGIVGGSNLAGPGGLLGFCPPPGSAPHAYQFTIYALDLAPTALAPGLGRADFFAAIKGHTLDVSSFVAFYNR